MNGLPVRENGPDDALPPHHRRFNLPAAPPLCRVSRTVIDRRIVSLLLFAVSSVSFFLPSLAGETRPETTNPQNAASRWKREGWPLLQQHCLDCHNADTQEAELDLSGLESFDTTEGGGGGEMQRVLEMVRFGAMPPEDAGELSDADRKTLVSSHERMIFSVSCDLRPRAGKVTLRRLNRAEYNNTIRDLFGMDLHPADAFPSDEVGAGFDNNGDLLSLSPMLMEKYITAAEYVATRVLVDPAGVDKEALPPSQKRILRRSAKRSDDRWVGVQDAAAACLGPLMRQAFREPVSKEEIHPYAQLAVQATERGESYHRGLQIAISAVLMSPRFLFRVEVPADNTLRPTPNQSPATQSTPNRSDIRLTSHQLATRLAYFLWSSIPDERLRRDADKNRLDGQVLERHVRRMLSDTKADSLATQFAGQWFGLRNLVTHEVNTDLFGRFDQQLKDAMARETELVFMHLVREDRPVAELLTADYSFLNERLAKHYGIAGVEGDEFRRVSTKGTLRRGILTHASVLTLTSNPGRTSPVKRGKWILENVLGTPPPEPPPGVPGLDETKTAKAGATWRQQLEVHRADPSCAACHRVMDQLGFGMEQFDAVGRFRKLDGGSPVDASGELPGGRTYNGAAELSDVLGSSERRAFARTAVQRLLTFALGRELSPDDRCTVDEIVETAAARDYRFVDLVLAVVNSRPFQYYEWSGPSDQGPIEQVPIEQVPIEQGPSNQAETRE